MLSLILSQFTHVGWLYKTADWLQFFENGKHVSAASMACLSVFVGALSIFVRLGSCQEQNSSVIYGSGGENTKKKCNTYSRYIQTHFFIPVCPENYTEYPGDVPGWGSIMSLPSFWGSSDLPPINDMNSCAYACNLTPDCCSFEFSQTEVKCNLNTECGPTTTEIYKDYIFCVKGINSCCSKIPNQY